MKKFSLLFFLLAFNAGSYAAKVIIVGEPVVLERKANVYYVPSDYKTTQSYYYVNVNGARQVCYLEKQPALSALNTATLEVNYNGSTLNWVCYPYDVNYFQTP